MLSIGVYSKIEEYKKLGYIPFSASNVRPIWYVEGSNEPRIAPPEPLISYDMEKNPDNRKEYIRIYNEYLNSVPDAVFLRYIESERKYVLICSQKWDEVSVQRDVLTHHINQRFHILLKEPQRKE